MADPVEPTQKTTQVTKASAVERFQRLEEIFHRASQLDGAARAEYLSESCGDDRSLLAEVEGMLALEKGAASGIEAAVGSGIRHWSNRHVPARLGPYRVLELLGRGGLGEVYLAERDDEHFHKRVAIKWIRPELSSSDLERRFRFERQVLAQLEHPHIARILDAGAEGGSTYLVMELVEGRPLLAYCRERQLDLRQKLTLFLKICEAVHYAHQNLVLHCDLKPSNILIDGQGSPKLLDFGIATALQQNRSDEGAAEASTRPGVRPLTPEYASPEQVQYQPLTTASDVYSLGVVLYELLTDQRPYEIGTDNPLEVARVIVEHEPSPPSERVEKLGGRAAWDPDLDAIVAMALRKEPEGRYRSVGQFVEDLGRFLELRPVAARRDTRFYRWSKLVRRHRMAVAAVTAVFLALSTATGITWRQAEVARSERLRAERSLELAEEEKDRAEAVIDLLVGLFETADPALALGSEITAREVLDLGSQRIRRQLKDRPKLRAALAGTIGRVYRELAIHDQAEVHLFDSLTTHLEVLDEGAPEVVKSRLELALLLLDQERLQEADRQLAKAIDSELGHRGASTPVYNALLRAQALSQIEQGRPEEAGQLLEQASILDAARRKGDTPTEDSADIWDLSVQVAYALGDFSRAEALAQKALDARRRLLGDEHPKVALSLNNLAAVREAVGDWQGALAVLEETLELRRKLYGPRHGAVALSLQNLAAVYLKVRDFDRTESLLDEADTILIALYGSDHTNYANSLHIRARLEKARRDPRRAAELFEQSLSIRRNKLGASHPSTAQSLMGLAESLRKLEPSRAESLYREVLELYRSTLTNQDPRLAQPLERLGTLLCGKDPAVGAPLLTEALEVRRQRAGDHWSTALGQARLGRCLIDLDPVQARSHLEEAADDLESLLGPEHSVTTRALGWLKEAQSESG